MSRPLATLTAALALALGACHSANTAPADEHKAMLLGVDAPATVAANSALDVVARYGRGACDSARKVAEREPAGARLGLRLTTHVEPGTACPDIMMIDTVSIHVSPPVTLPYTVRLERRDAPDSVIVIRAAQ